MATKGAFKKGHKKLGGRAKGTPNQYTSTVKEGVLAIFQEIQEDPTAKWPLRKFADKYPIYFYNLAARLIPTEIKGGFDKIKLEIVRIDDTGETEETAP